MKLYDFHMDQAVSENKKNLNQYDNEDVIGETYDGLHVAHRHLEPLFSA